MGSYSKITKLFPNPFRENITIEFAFNVRQKTRVSVYDIKGQEIAVLMNGEMDAGTHLISWDGKNKQGLEMGPNVYLLKFSSINFSETKRLFKIR